MPHRELNPTESEIREAVESANIPTLLMVLVQASGDHSWLEDPYRPTRTRGLSSHDSGGLSPEVQEVVRVSAVKVITERLSGQPPAIAQPDEQLTLRMLSVCMGEEIPSEYGSMLCHELRRFQDQRHVMDTLDAPDDYHVAIIGAGVSGIIAAVYCDGMGIPYTVLERNETPGGTWLQNRYPGCGIDTPSHLYSFSFAKWDWENHFEMRTEIFEYLDAVYSDFGIDKNTRFRTEVLHTRYSEARQTWELTIRQDGQTRTMEADAIISGSGILNIPKIPELPGLETYSGVSCHTAEWPEDLDLTGKRVAVVGTGASAMQVVPAIADDVSSLKVFQRSPQWIAPFEHFRKEIPPGARLLLHELPEYQAWYWLRLFWQFGDRVLEALEKDPDWEQPDISVNAQNDGHRRAFTRYIEERLEGRPDLLAKAIPNYPPFGKRILLDNGWYSALRKENVELICEPVTGVEASGLISESGDTHEVDVIIWATGFHATRFIGSYDVYGLGGKRLRDVWGDDDGAAYLGAVTHGFPNFFMLGGPHSFPGAGSFMFFMEMQMNYVRSVLSEVIDRKTGPVHPSAELVEQHNREIDAKHEQMIWTHPGMSTYYRNEKGRVIFVSPFRNLDYWHMSRSADLDEFCLESLRRE